MRLMSGVLEALPRAAQRAGGRREEAELLVETVLTVVKVSCTATVEVARGVARRAARRAGCTCYHPEVRGRWWQTPGQVS